MEFCVVFFVFLIVIGFIYIFILVGVMIKFVIIKERVLYFENLVVCIKRRKCYIFKIWFLLIIENYN